MAAGPVEPDANTPADAAASVPATELDRVVVTATRQADDALLVPAAVDVVGTEDLRRARPQLSLSESLQRVPGVVARDRQNQAQGLQVSNRGFGARAGFGIRGVRAEEHTSELQPLMRISYADSCLKTKMKHMQ